MARGVDISVSINRRQLRELQRNLEAFPINAAQVGQTAANAVARDARDRVKKVIPEVFDQPEDLTRNAIVARRKRVSSVHSLKNISADIAIKPLRERWMRYHLGDEEQTRKPGVIGPAKKLVMIPEWDNLTSAEAKEVGVDIVPTKDGNLPQGSLRKLFNNTGRGGRLWWGQIPPGGAKGRWLRPTRIGRKNLGANKLLIAAKDQMKYRQSLEQPMREAMRKASRGFAKHLRKAVMRQRWRS